MSSLEWQQRQSQRHLEHICFSFSLYFAVSPTTSVRAFKALPSSCTPPQFWGITTGFELDTWCQSGLPFVAAMWDYLNFVLVTLVSPLNANYEGRLHQSGSNDNASKSNLSFISTVLVLKQCFLRLLVSYGTIQITPCKYLQITRETKH